MERNDNVQGERCDAEKNYDRGSCGAKTFFLRQVLQLERYRRIQSRSMLSHHSVHCKLPWEHRGKTDTAGDDERLYAEDIVQHLELSIPTHL